MSAPFVKPEGVFESMKSRDSLIRLKRFQADEKRRQVAQIEAMIAEFERMAKELDDQILAEQERSGIRDAGTSPIRPSPRRRCSDATICGSRPTT